MNAFVSIGSTKFDQLFEALLTPAFAIILKSHKFSSLTVQYGNSSLPNDITENELTVLFNSSEIFLDIYKYKPSIQEDMLKSNLVISHCGAGTILDSLRCHKPLVAVINNTLMGNHQIQMAQKFADLGKILFVESPEELIDNFERISEDLGKLDLEWKVNNDVVLNIIDDMLLGDEHKKQS